MVGNGMRPEVWEPFAVRFNVPRIGEFYASTEGNVALWNTLGETGAVGYVPPMVRMMSPYTIVKYDVDKDEIVRDSKGFAIKCNYDEPGELLAQINPGEITRDFGGYTDQAASQKKVLSNVLKKGDTYFRTGDLVKLSKRGFFYFHDRIGDTFRWKGENVSTSEVEQVLNTIPGVREATVYGVQVPHCEGRAGMAYLVTDPHQFNWDTYQQRVAKELPSYAAPIFVRFGQEVETTSTFKHKKTNMMRDGFNPALVSDPLFVRDDSHKRFVPLTKEVYEKICTQNLFAKL
jgi:fatty-acyl-CoA synthase